MPVIITTEATSRPKALVGTRSPYPIVVTVCTAHHRPWPMSEKFLWSAKRISTPLQCHREGRQRNDAGCAARGQWLSGRFRGVSDHITLITAGDSAGPSRDGSGSSALGSWTARRAGDRLRK
jgi:hypothetical protein